jgi:hypothetical protein
MRYLLFAIFAGCAFAQIKSHNFQLIVDPAGTTTGSIFFDTSRSDGKFITIKAPTTATANYTLTLPTAAPANNGDCLTGTTAGVLSFGSCGTTSGAVLTTTNQEVEGFKYFGVSGSDRLVMYRATDNQMGIQTMLDGNTDPTTYSYGGTNNVLLLQPRAGIVGIGASNASYNLYVDGTFGTSNFASIAGNLAVGSTDTTIARLFARAADVNGLRIHNTAAASPTGGAGIQAAIESTPASGDRLAFYAFGLRTGGVPYSGAAITAFATQNWTPGSAQGTELRFETTANGAASRNTSLVVRSGEVSFAANQAFSAHNTYGIGSASVRPSVVYSQIDNTRKQEISDTAGGGGFWDKRVNATGVTSDWTLRDNVGSRALKYTRVFASSPDNSFEIFGAVLPAQRSTGSGDAVNDATAPSLGSTARRWNALWADAATITNDLAVTTVTATTVSSTNMDAGVITATTSLLPDVDNGSILGGSSLRFTKLWTYDLDASGTIRFPTGAVSGYCWKSDGSGNGSWQVCGTGVTSIATTSPISGGTITTTGTISCPTCYTTSGGTISGSVVVTGTLAVNSNMSTVGVTFGGNLLPSLDSTWEIGSAGARVAGLYYNGADTYGSHRIRNGANITVQSGGVISINSGGSISAASGSDATIYVGSGNFYLRTFSGGDASCGGITNGWVGFRTDTNELQICNGGATRKVAM